MDWPTIENELKELSKKITTPQIIIGITRGGIIPARCLSSILGVKSMHCIGVAKIGEERKVITEILEDLKGKNILLVEDMLESGKSIIVAKKYLESKGAKVKTACLYIMPQSEIIPDYYLKKVKEVQNFPWEKN